MNKVTGTFTGKHDLQLQKEMNEILNDAGLSAWTSFERRRGRVGLVAKANEIMSATALLLIKHPDISFSYENPAHGETHFLYFNQIM